jgi:hypothetical protein
MYSVIHYSSIHHRYNLKDEQRIFLSFGRRALLDQKFPFLQTGPKTHWTRRPQYPSITVQLRPRSTVQLIALLAKNGGNRGARLHLDEAVRKEGRAAHRILTFEGGHPRGMSIFIKDFERKVKELRLRNDEQTAPKQFTIFRSQRSFCTVCRKCATYRGNFGKHPLPWPADPTKSVEFLGCLHCRCPMNAHELVRPLPQRRKEVWSYMKSKRMRE